MEFIVWNITRFISKTAFKEKDSLCTNVMVSYNSFLHLDLLGNSVIETLMQHLGG